MVYHGVGFNFVEYCEEIFVNSQNNGTPTVTINSRRVRSVCPDPCAWIFYMKIFLIVHTVRSVEENGYSELTQNMFIASVRLSARLSVCLSFVRLQRKIYNTWQCIIGLIRQQIR